MTVDEFRRLESLILVLILLLGSTYVCMDEAYPRPGGLAVVDSFWGTRGQPRKAYPGTRDNLLTVLLRNDMDENVTSLTGYLALPGGFTDFYGRKTPVDTWSGSLEPGDTVSLSYHIDIDSSVEPGTYYASLTVEYILEDGSEGEVDLNVALHVDPTPVLRIEVVNIYWGSPGNPYIAVPGSRDVDLVVEVLNLDNYPIRELTAYLDLPGDIKDLYGSDEVVCTVSGVGAGGGLARLVFRSLQVSEDASPGSYLCRLDLEYLFDLEGSTVEQSRGFDIYVKISGKPEAPVELASAYWSYGGEPTVAFPGSRGISLHLTLVNLGSYDVSASKVEVKTPKGFRLLRASGSIFNPTPSGSSASLNLDFNITEETAPGKYILHLTLWYVIHCGGKGTEAKASLRIPVEVEDPSGVDTELEVVSAYWGSPGNLRVATPGSRLMPLTLEIMNRGVYQASSLVIDFALPDGFKPSYGFARASVRSLIASGGSASVTIYLDLDLGVAPGLHTFQVNISYRVSVGGAVFDRFKTFNITLPVEEAAGSSYLEVSSVDWADGRPVYPGDEDVELTVGLVNRAAYPISGVHAILYLPEGFEGDYGSSTVELYEQGSIRRWGGFTLSFKMSIDKGLSPGIYEMVLQLNYILESGGLGVKCEETHVLKVEVSRLEGVEFVQSLWYGSSAGPGDTGVRLLTVLRNTGIPSMSGIVGYVEMPRGFTIVLTGNRTAKLIPSSLRATTSIPTLGAGVIPSEIPLQLQPMSSASKGDDIYFMIPLNISLDVPTGNYRFNITLSFLDQWGSLQEIPVRCTLPLLGSIKLIRVEAVSTLLIIGEPDNRLSLKLVNQGTAPAYDVYLGILGLPPGLSVEQSMFYIPSIPAGGEAVVETNVYINPDIQYKGPMTGLALIMFKDVYGTLQKYNQTFPLMVRGNIEFQVMSVTSTPSPAYKGALLMVSGIILNRGRETAKHVSVYLLKSSAVELTEGSSQYIGDIDPDAQVPFTIEAEVVGEEGFYNLTLIVEYFDNYGGSYSKIYQFPLEVGPPPKAEAPPLEEQFYRFLPAILTGVFLVVIGYLVLRYIRRTMGRGG